METQSEIRSMRVTHKVVDGKHVVTIFTPDNTEFRIARWPVDEDSTSFHAIMTGYYEACDWCKIFNATRILVTSTDAGAMGEFDREMERPADA